MRKRPLAGILFFALSASLSAQATEAPSATGGEGSAQETLASEPSEAKEEDAEAALPIAASAWCTFLDSKEKKSAAPSEEEDPPVEDEESATPLGCDAGIGISVYRWRRLAVVGVLGSKSVGAGLGWIIGKPMGRTLAVAAGYVCPWSSQGIVGNGCQLALGATVSLLRSESP